MGSWYAVERFVHAVRESGNPNITCWYEPGDTAFTFANGQIGKAEYKLAIQFQTSRPCCTYVDILDQGKVPLLVSIEQMRNLNVTIEHTNEGDFMTCPSLGFEASPLADGPLRSCDARPDLLRETGHFFCSIR